LKNVARIICSLSIGAGIAAWAWAAPPSQSDGRVLYKWVDAGGVTHYGDRIPPEYASQEQHMLNSRGIEVGHTDAQKSSEQLQADEQKKRDAEQREIRDKNLLSTYASVQEIERLRDQRVQLVADQIKVTTQYLENLDGRMKRMRTDSMRFKPYSSDPKAPSMPDQVA
jgi:Domain of unknown function (DUF4124)